MLVVIPIGKYISLPSSKQLFFSVDGDYHRKLQLVKIQKTAYHGYHEVFTSRDTMRVLHLRLSKHRQDGAEIFKSQRTEGYFEEIGGREHRKGWRKEKNGVNEVVIF